MERIRAHKCSIRQIVCFCILLKAWNGKKRKISASKNGLGRLKTKNRQKTTFHWIFPKFFARFFFFFQKKWCKNSVSRFEIQNYAGKSLHGLEIQKQILDRPPVYSSRNCPFMAFFDFEV